VLSKPKRDKGITIKRKEKKCSLPTVETFAAFSAILDPIKPETGLI